MTSNASSHANGTTPSGPPLSILRTEEAIRIFSICCYTLILLLSLVGNSTIIAVVLRHKPMRSKANVLIINMAVADLVATLLSLPRMLQVFITKSNYEWNVPAILAGVLCKVIPFMREVACAVSIFSSVAIAVDRFFAIVFPMIRKPFLLKLKFLIPAIWVSCMGANALYLDAFKIEKQFCKNTLTNQVEVIFDTFRFVTVIAAPFLVLVVLYVIIAITMNRQSIPGAITQTSLSHRRQQNKNIVKLAVAIVVCFFVAWVPYYVLLLLFLYQWQSQKPPLHLFAIIFVLQSVFEILTYASFAVNPYICLGFSSNFRRFTRRTFMGSRPQSTRAFTRTATEINPTTPRGLSISNIEIPMENMGESGNVNRAHEREPTARNGRLEGCSEYSHGSCQIKSS